MADDPMISEVYGYQQVRTKPASSGSELVPPGQGGAKGTANFQELGLTSRSQELPLEETGHHHEKALDLKVSIQENIEHVKTQEQVTQPS